MARSRSTARTCADQPSTSGGGGSKPGNGKLAPPRTDLSEILDVASTAELEAIRAAGEAGQLDGLERLIKE